MKKTKAKPEVVDKFAHWPKRDFKEGAKVKFGEEINGCPVGTRAEVLRPKHDGAIFLIRVLAGPKHGQEFVVAARDLA